jgi:hypothetical protein
MFGIGLLIEGQILYDLNQTISSSGDPFAETENINIGPILHMYPTEYVNNIVLIRYIIPAIVLFICSGVTITSTYFLYKKKRQNFVLFGMDFSTIGGVLCIYYLITIIHGLIFDSWVNLDEDYGEIILFPLVVYSILGIFTIILIFMLRKPKRRFLTSYFLKKAILFNS